MDLQEVNIKPERLQALFSAGINPPIEEDYMVLIREDMDFEDVLAYKSAEYIDDLN
jgi:hypothetical protein